MFKSIKSKIAVVFVIVSLILTVSLSVLNYFQSKAALEAEIYDKAIQRAQNQANTIHEWFLGISKEVEVLAMTSDMYEMDWERQLPIISRIVDSNDNYDSIFVVDPTGSAKTDNDGSIEVGDRDWFQGSMKNQLVFSEPIISRETNENIIVVSAPISKPNSNTPVGVLAFTIKLDKIVTMIKNLNGFEGWIIDSQMKTVAHQNQKYLGNQDLFIGNSELTKIAQKMTNGETGYGYYSLQGIERFTAYSPIAITGWSIGLAISSEDINAPINKMLQSNIILTLVAFLVVGVISWIVGTMITKPILQLLDGFNEIGQGDFTKEVSVTSKDELGQFAIAFNQLIGKLRNLIKEIIETSVVVNDGSTQLAGIADEQAKVINQIASVYNQVAQGSQQQSVDIVNAKKTIDELSSAIEQVSKGAQDQVTEVNKTTDRTTEMINDLNRALDFVDQLAKAANLSVDYSAKGEQIVAKVAKGMGVLNNNVNSTIESVQELQQNSQQIESIINVIEEIADQTNLLALNAAIEAARAGEHGKGFAVVAEEVRILAAKVRNSTNEINGIISKLYSSIVNTVEDVKKNGVQIEEGTQLANEAKEALAGIAKSALESGDALKEFKALTGRLKDSSENVSKSITKILSITEENSASAEEMYASSENVVSLIESLAAISEENSASAEEVAAASEEQSAAIEEMSSSASNLSEVSNKLKKATDQFTV